jgi:hypothetical protein
MMIPIPLNLRGLVAVSIALIIFILIVIGRDTKHKSEYDHITGEIIYFEKQLGKFPSRNFGKYRYIKLSNYEYSFEIFIGNEFGDFKPKFEQIDNLKLGDTITVFFYETSDVQKNWINRHVQYIDMKDNSFFERGASSKKIGMVAILLCVFIALGGFVLWKFKKIEF